MTNKNLPLKPEDLGNLDDLWRGWRVSHGKLWEPDSTSPAGWLPGHVQGLRFQYQRISALEIELARTNDNLLTLQNLIGEQGIKDAAATIQRRLKRRATGTGSKDNTGLADLIHKWPAQRPERDPRQLTTLARTTQEQEKAEERRAGNDRRNGSRSPLAPPFSLTWQSRLPRPAKAIPPATRSERK